jgi:NADP-dependent 3-hydroxy acid dehydrogenase YdfG
MKTILITGATSGIGKSTAELLAKQGNRIIICGRRAEVLESVKSELSQYTEIFSLKFDVRNLEEVEAASIHFLKTGKILMFLSIMPGMLMDLILSLPERQMTGIL